MNIKHTKQKKIKITNLHLKAEKIKKDKKEYETVIPIRIVGD